MAIKIGFDMTVDKKLNYLDATSAEQRVIKQFLSKAREIFPKTELRFVQRDQDSFGKLLVFGLKVSDVDNAENFRLYELAQDFYEEGKLTVAVTMSSSPNSNQQLLRLKPFLKNDELADEAQSLEPSTSFWARFRPRRFQVNAIAFVIVGSSIGILIFDTGQWVHRSFPQFFPGVVQLRGADRYIKTARQSLDQTIAEIKYELSSRVIDHEGEEYKDLQKQRALMEKARADLQ